MSTSDNKDRQGAVLENWSIIKCLHNSMVHFKIQVLHWDNFLSLITISFQTDIYNAIFRSLEMCFWFIISALITAVSDKKWVYKIRAQIIRAFDL